MKFTLLEGYPKPVKELADLLTSIVCGVLDWIISRLFRNSQALSFDEWCVRIWQLNVSAAFFFTFSFLYKIYYAFSHLIGLCVWSSLNSRLWLILKDSSFPKELSHTYYTLGLGKTTVLFLVSWSLVCCSGVCKRGEELGFPSCYL